MKPIAEDPRVQGCTVKHKVSTKAEDCGEFDCSKCVWQAVNLKKRMDVFKRLTPVQRTVNINGSVRVVTQYIIPKRS